MMLNITNHKRSALLWSGGIIIGLLAMLAQQAWGWGVIPAALAGPAWVGYRHLRAHVERLLLRRLARKHGKNWIEPEVSDGQLVWQFETGGDPAFVGCSIVVPSWSVKHEASFFDGPPFVIREHEEESKPVDDRPREKGVVPLLRAASRVASPKMGPETWAKFKAAMQDALRNATPSMSMRLPQSPNHDVSDLIGVSPARADFPRAYMYTADSTYWDFAEPTVERVRLVPLVMGCIQAPRFGGQLPVTEAKLADLVATDNWRWSVAQHSCLAGWVAWLIASDDLAFIHECTAHDAHEGLYGDVPSPLKSQCPDYKAAEKKGAKVVRQRLGVPLDMTARALVVDGLCLVAEATLVHGFWPHEWADESFIANAVHMQIYERAVMLRDMQPEVFADALLVGLVDPSAFVKSHVEQWEMVFQVGRENGNG